MRTEEVPLAELAARGATAAAAGPLLVAADVGATNVRVALAPAGRSAAPVPFAAAKASSVPALLATLRRFADALGPAVTGAVAAAAVAIPGPVSGGAAVCANYAPEGPDGRTIRLAALPAALFPPGRAALLNDLEAAANGVAGLSAAGALPDLFTSMWRPAAAGAVPRPLRADGRPAVLPACHVLVLAPGTGLGSALLAYCPRAAAHRVLPLEFGHTAMALADGPARGRDEAFLAAYSGRLGHWPVEWDDVCSGRGLEALHGFRAAGLADPTASAGEVGRRAAAGDAAAAGALGDYFRHLMGYSAQLVMGLQAFEVLLVGDNVVRNAAALAAAGDEAPGAAPSPLHRALLAHTAERLGFMSRAGACRQVAPANLNVAGCVHAAAQLAAPAAAPASRL